MDIKSQPFPPFCLELPAWITEYLSQQSKIYPIPEARMELVTTLSELNIQHGTGGPFGAAVFRLDTHELVAPGVNLVVSSRNSMAHAEMVAITVAQQILGSHDLGAKGFPPHELVSSCEPCAMCLGAIPWSGIQQVMCGAQGKDAEAVGFDEGSKPDNWIMPLEQRGIKVIGDIGRIKASQVLQHYVQNGGEVYNGRRG